MKTLLLTLLALMAVSVVSAQITITNSALAPAGTEIIMAYDSTNAAQITPGEPGTDKLWDFSLLTVQDTDIVSLMLPSDTPYGDAFPMANFAIGIVSSDSYAYFNRTNSVFSNIGVAATVENYGFVTMSMVPPNIYLDFPESYGNTRQEQYSMQIKIADNSLPGVDSVKYKSSTTENLTVDAWGTMVLPIGTFSALRQKEEKTVRDSIWMHFFGNWILLSSSVDEVDTYNWWTDDVGAGFTLCSIDVDRPTQEVTNIAFLNSYTVGQNEISADQVHCYPNPTDREAMIIFPATMTLQYVSLYTLSGSLVEIDTEIVPGQVTLHMDQLPAGTYVALLKFYNGQTITTKIARRN
ncbi:MAG: hypothetical protein CVT99_11990 [Bacteroidetes bacterium HGW-Bacteroidetes-16]|jgi:hypothetical protein|nr:MAG: hypothetical protein CVT99_11990 [Bacteroidetes bacterium HGW-Bacteroidetes-16]